MQIVKIDTRQKRNSWDRECPTGIYLRQAMEPPVIPEKTVETGPGSLVSVLPGTAGSQKTQRVAAYCRVSTLMESQETSIRAQREHYEQAIRSNSAWEFAGIYLEAGVSATKAETRPALQRMLLDCEAGKIDLILTKSISRFSRNTQDCLEMVRALTALGVHIYFEKEQIFTDAMESEFLLSILACLAEEESRSISENMKWGIRKRFRSGTYRQAVPPYGYEWAQGRLAVVPEQAAVVRDIFAMALSGTGACRISQALNRRGVPAAGGGKWNPGTVRFMLKNQCYMGDTLFQKKYTDENFKQRRNHGELDLYYEAGHHEAIVSREDFEKVQTAIGQRAREVGYCKGAEKARSVHRSCFSGVLFCRECGSVMHRQTDASGHVHWTCQRHTAHLALCHMKPQWDADLKSAFLNCLNKLAWSQGRKEGGVLDLYTRLGGGAETEVFPTVAVPRGTVRELKEFLSGWNMTADPADFPQKAFSVFVEKCTVDSGKAVTFHFRCGLELTESLHRERLEDPAWT